jgi:RNA polymerase sigma-70 factor (ECF subfamily)
MSIREAAASDEAFRGSHEEAVSTLVENHRRFLDFLERRLGDRTRAEDILQAAFARGLQQVPEAISKESAVAWFFRMLRNAIVDEYRREGRSSGLVEEGIDPNTLAEDPDVVREVCRCVLELAQTLKPEYAEALKRVDVEGAAVQEFAREAGITSNNASVRLFRAREALEKRVRATCRTCAEHGCLDCTCSKPGSRRNPD